VDLWEQWLSTSLTLFWRAKYLTTLWVIPNSIFQDYIILRTFGKSVCTDDNNTTCLSSCLILYHIILFLGGQYKIVFDFHVVSQIGSRNHNDGLSLFFTLILQVILIVLPNSNWQSTLPIHPIIFVIVLPLLLMILKYHYWY